MKNEETEKWEGKVFDADKIDRAMEEHIERVGSIEAIDEVSKTGKEDGSPIRTNEWKDMEEWRNGDLCDCNETCGCDICSGDDLSEALETPPVKNMGKSANAGLTRDDSLTATRLLDKNWSPLIVRKYQMESWPLYIGIICDCNLNDLDNVIYDARDEAEKLGFIDGNIQDVRNFVGYLSDAIKKHYNAIKRGSVEGVAVLWYTDKMFCSSLDGDFMTHYSCKMELYQIVNTLPHI